MTPLEIITNEIMTSSLKTKAGAWISSDHVTSTCDKWRKEREENIREKRCSCGNDCSNDERAFVFGEYICSECQ